MEVEVLRWFQLVATGATVTETARQAHITQPALSRALARMEHEVGTQLFQRVGRSLRPTPAGLLFKQHLDQALDRLDTGMRAVRELVDPDRGVVPVAFMHTLGTWLVPALVSGFRESNPNIRFELRQDGDVAVLDALLDGAVDLALTSKGPTNPHVRWRRLLVERLCLAVPPRHRLAGRKRVRLAEAADEPFVVLRHGYGLRSITEDLCRQAGFQLSVAFEGDDVATLRGLVGAGLGVSLLPQPQFVTSSAPGTTPATSVTSESSSTKSTAEAVTGSATMATPVGTDRMVPHLRVADEGSSRDIGVAWLAGRELPPASANFLRHVLAAGPGTVPCADNPIAAGDIRRGGHPRGRTSG